MTEKENILRTYRFGNPDMIPIRLNVKPACWNFYDHKELETLMKDHKILFPDYIKECYKKIKLKPWQKAGVSYTDYWGCTWETTEDGITGITTRHPLDDWGKFELFKSPDPEVTNGRDEVHWKSIMYMFNEAVKEDKIKYGSLVHGYFFLMLCDLRGYENLTYDMYDDRPELIGLIDMIEGFSRELVEKYISLGADIIEFPEDLGTQNNLMISPEMFKKYIKPTYKRLMSIVKQNKILIHMHSDGYIMELIDDLIECGVDCINLQDIVNGIDSIEKNIKGRICIDLDIDRQSITRFGTPKEIDELIYEEVRRLGSKEGGLMLKYGFYPGIPIENIRAVMDAMEKYSMYFSN